MSFELTRDFTVNQPKKKVTIIIMTNRSSEILSEMGCSGCIIGDGNIPGICEFNSRLIFNYNTQMRNQSMMILNSIGSDTGFNLTSSTNNKNTSTIYLGNEINYSTHLGKNIYSPNNLLATHIGANVNQNSAPISNNSIIIGTQIEGSKFDDSVVIGNTINSEVIEKSIIIGSPESIGGSSSMIAINAKVPQHGSIIIGSSVSENTNSSAQIRIGSNVNILDSGSHIGTADHDIKTNRLTIGNTPGPRITINSENKTILNGGLHIGGQFTDGGEHITASYIYYDTEFKLKEASANGTDLSYFGNRMLLQFGNSDSLLKFGELKYTQIINSGDYDELLETYRDSTEPDEIAEQRIKYVKCTEQNFDKLSQIHTLSDQYHSWALLFTSNPDVKTPGNYCLPFETF